MRSFKLAAAAAALFIYSAAPVHAQSTALVVLKCGTPPVTLVVGQIYPLTMDLTGAFCGNVSSGAAGTVATGAAAGSYVTGYSPDLGTFGSVSPAGGGSAPSGTLNALNLLAGVYNAAVAPIGMPVNITEHDCSVTLTTGATAQNAFAATATIHGFRIINADTTHIEDVWFSTTTTAAANAAQSYRLAASPAANTTVQSASYTSPSGEGVNTALSVIAATTAHIITCTYW